MTELSTWAGKSKFSYEGSVKEGTKIAISSYVGPILIQEGYAEKLEGANIKGY